METMKMETMKMETMKMETMKQEINRIARNLSKAATRWPQTGEALKKRILNALDFELDCIEFETPTAEFMFHSLVKKTFAAKYRAEYELVWPPMYMDANGNYTYDSTKWV